MFLVRRCGVHLLGCVCVFASAGGGASQWDVLRCAVLG